LNTHQDSDELIRQYLLGALSEEETERLDELSVADDEFAGRLNALETDLIDAYARGDLSGQTLERFNSFYLASPRRSEKVRFAKAFQDVADRTVVAAEMDGRRRTFPDASTEEKLTSRPRSRRKSFFFPTPVFAWAAACAALLIAVIGLAVVNLRLRQQMNEASAQRAVLEERDRELRSELDSVRSSASEQEKEVETLRDKVAQLEQRPVEPAQSALTHTPNVESFALSPQTRGIGQPRGLLIPADTDLVALQLDLESGYTSYRAELKSLPDRQTVWRSGRLRAKTRDDRRVIEIALKPAVLKSQAYLLEVTGISASGTQEPAGNYSFRVEKK
jgi:hypothetical protein